MNHYTSLMRKHGDPRLIEGFMRLEHGTLDHLSATDFEREAEIAAQCVATDPDLAERLAQSFGL